MTWAIRLKLAAGVLLVLVLAAVLTYHLNQTRGRATSDSAQILAHEYRVGTPYAGLVVAQRVEIGDAVREGQSLFVVDSAALTRDLALGTVRAAGESTRIDDDGRLVVLASGDGVVTALDAQEGTFVDAASPLATVQRAGSLYVQAEYTLSPKEYARVDDGADVTILLPDQTSVAGRVERVQVTTVGGAALALVTVTSDALEDGGHHGLMGAGTPVAASLTLRNDGVVTTVSDAVEAYVRGIFG